MDRFFKRFKKVPDIHESSDSLNKIAHEHMVTETQINFYTSQPDFDDNIEFIATHMDPNDPKKVKELQEFLQNLPEQKMLVYAKLIGDSLVQIRNENNRSSQ